MCTYFKTETEDHSLRKKYWGTGLVSGKMEALYAELNETVEAATSSYSATSKFLRYNFYNFYSVLVAKNHLKIQSVFSSWIFLHRYFFTLWFIWLWLLIAIMKRCTLQLYRTSLSIFILFQLQSWIILRVRTKFLFRNFHAKRVIMEIAMMKILNNYIPGRLNSNYFPLKWKFQSLVTMFCLFNNCLEKYLSKKLFQNF